MDNAAREWACEEFGEAELGDRRRTARLVRLAACAAAAPAGTVTAVVASSAEREGAYRLLENPAVSSAAVASASHAATLKRCRSRPWVYVAVDGSSLSLTDRACIRDIGHVGAWRHPSRGLIVTSALAVAKDGTPLGLCGQRWWARTERARPAKKRRPRYVALAKTEMQHSVRLLEELHACFAEQAPETQPWYQLDRNYDAWSVLHLAHERKMRITVRMVHDRCVRESGKAEKNYLSACIKQAPLLGRRALQVPARPGRPARVAQLDIRACRVTLELAIARKRRAYVPMFVVQAREADGPLHWMLLTTVGVQCLDEALAVIDGYASRWRIEEFHRAWKNGVCHVEDTQLRGREALLKWATILAAVAARATRLTYLARETPDADAANELSRWELDAIILLRRPKGFQRGATLTLSQAIRWIAELGGYTGKSSGGPPGPTVIARGLEKIEVAATMLKNMGEM